MNGLVRMNTWLLPILLILSQGIDASSLVSNQMQDLGQFLNNFLDLEHMDMFMISSERTSWERSTDADWLLASVFQNQHSIFHYDIDEMERLQREFPEEPCPVYQSQVGSAINYTTFKKEHGALYKRRPLFMNGKHQRFLFVHLNNKHLIPKVLQIMDNAILWCDEKRDLAFYHADTRLMFLINNEEEMDMIYAHSNIQLHAKVSVMLYRPFNRKFMIYNYNYFQRQRYPVFAWSKDNMFLHTKDVYNNIRNFNSHHFRVGTNLYSHHMLATKLKKDEGYTKTNKYKDYWGYEYFMIEEASKRLQFNFTILNPADGQWGKVSEKTGKWTGVVGDVAYNKIDIAVSAIFQTFPRRMVIDGTVHFSDDYLVIVAPRAKKFPQYLALINPFTPTVWLCMGIIVFISSLAFYIVAKVEQKVVQTNLSAWSELNHAFWYVYGTLIGESITRDTKSKNANAVRCVIVVWLIYSFIILSAYGGELKAFLTNPRFTSPIETVEGVVESGLPWGMVLYGEDEERIMAESNDPNLKRLWDEKKTMDYIPVIDLNPVVEEEMIKIDWKSGLEPIIYVRYSTPGGDPLVHKAPNPILMNNYCGWAFYPHNRWREAFDEFLQRSKEAGLVNNWIKRTWYQMDADFIRSGHVEKREFEPTTAPLTMSDLQGLFYLSMLALLVDTVVFSLEVLYIKRQQRINNNYSR